MAKIHVNTTINGAPTEFLCDANQTLLDVLRDTLGLTGSKEGCGSGDCGACSVMVNGRLVCSCLVLAPEAEGMKVETIEGMAHGDKLHPLQSKFVEMAALECGRHVGDDPRGLRDVGRQKLIDERLVIASERGQ